MTEKQSEFKKKLTICCFAAFPSAFLAMYLLTPGYMIPFLTHRFVIIFLGLLFCWQAIGSLAYIKIPPERIYSLRLQSFLFLLIFVAPSILTAMFGPALGIDIAILVVSVFFPHPSVE